ncbi:MAG: HEAT repeat domain-containing protein [Myxococcales bacterium]|nr:HEAT repeat domain-containing protein [Myxococcales bacterium]
MTSRTAFVLLLGLAGCASQQSAEPEPPPPAKTKAANVAAPATTTSESCDVSVVRLLSIPHEPPSVSDVRAVCGEPVPVLIAVADDAGRPGFERLRALSLLGRFETSAARGALLRASKSGDLASIRRTAVEALSHHPASTARNDALRAALKDPDPHVRLAATRALAADESQETRAALTEAGRVETEPFVKKELDSATR